MIEYKVTVYIDRTEWFNIQGQRHREDGPAIEYANGSRFWYLNGKAISEKEFYLKPKTYEGEEVEIEGKTYILKSK